MADFPRNFTVIPGDVSPLGIQIGDLVLNSLHIQKPGPIVVVLGESVDYPKVAWIPLFFQGAISDPDGVLRVVREGDETLIRAGVPDVPDPRQAAYAAVCKILEPSGGAFGAGSYGVVWRAVHAALNAAQVGEPVDPGTGKPMPPEDAPHG